MKSIGFIGCGNMATAMIQGILKRKLTYPDQIFTSNSKEETAALTAQRLGVVTSTNNTFVAQAADIIFLSVKPQMYPAVIEEIADSITPDKIVISIAPGKTLSWLSQAFKKPVKLVRTMPNTPALVGEGLTSYCANSLVTFDELVEVENILSSFGEIIKLKEELIDAASAVGGSAPAFVYMFIEALADGGVAEGLTRADAYKIAAQTVLGSAAMVLETKNHPAKLKDDVCSPGGSTIAGVEALEKGGFRGTVIDAVRSTTAKARGL